MSHPAEQKRYDVLFSGSLRTGFTAESANMNLSQTEDLRASGIPSIDVEGGRAVIFTTPSKDKAMKICKVLHNAGLSCKVRRKTASADNNPVAETRVLPAYYIIVGLIIIIAIMIIRSLSV